MIRPRFQSHIRLSLLSLVAFIALLGCTGDKAIKTLKPGVLTIAVTTDNPIGPYNPQLWINQYIERFAEEHELTISWVVVPFSESWLLASRNEVDLVATNVASFSDRVTAGASFSTPFLYERRALRIHPADQGRYAGINDFVDKTVGVVSGTAAERDVDGRAPEGINVVRLSTFAELYTQFDTGNLDAIAEAEYYALNDQVIPSHGDEVILIDHHDMNPGQREESVFVVSDGSENLLDALNRFITTTDFPL